MSLSPEVTPNQEAMPDYVSPDDTATLEELEHKESRREGFANLVRRSRKRAAEGEVGEPKRVKRNKSLSDQVVAAHKLVQEREELELEEDGVQMCVMCDENVNDCVCFDMLDSYKDDSPLSYTVAEEKRPPMSADEKRAREIESDDENDVNVGSIIECSKIFQNAFKIDKSDTEEYERICGTPPPLPQQLSEEDISHIKNLQLLTHTFVQLKCEPEDDVEEDPLIRCVRVSDTVVGPKGGKWAWCLISGEEEKVEDRVPYLVFGCVDALDSDDDKFWGDCLLGEDELEIPSVHQIRAMVSLGRSLLAPTHDKCHFTTAKDCCVCMNA